MAQVRRLLQDRTKWGWFLHYDGCRTADGEYVCRNNATGEIDASANLWHVHQIQRAVALGPTAHYVVVSLD